MALTAPRQKLAGRIGALLGIILMALSLRAAVVSVPPLLGSIGPELGFDSFSTGLLAMLAPVVFAGFGLLTPRLIRWWGLERVLVAAVLLAVAGQLLRAVVGDVPSFLLLSAITLAGYGMGNVVLPPLVKKYFPDRLAMVTSGYVTMLAVGTWMAPQFSVPLAKATGNWRSSIAAWALLSAVVLVPWGIQLLRDRKQPAPRHPAGQPAWPQRRRRGSTHGNPRLPGAWRSSWPVTRPRPTFTSPGCRPISPNRGWTTAAAGSMLALFAILGLPVSLLVPLWVPRLRHPILAVLVFTACWITGHLGTVSLADRAHRHLGGVFRPGPGHLRHGPADDEPALAQHLRLRGPLRLQPGPGLCGGGHRPAALWHCQGRHRWLEPPPLRCSASASW